MRGALVLVLSVLPMLVHVVEAQDDKETGDGIVETETFYDNREWQAVVPSTADLEALSGVGVPSEDLRMAAVEEGGQGQEGRGGVEEGQRDEKRRKTRRRGRRKKQRRPYLPDLNGDGPVNHDTPDREVPQHEAVAPPEIHYIEEHPFTEIPQVDEPQTERKAKSYRKPYRRHRNEETQEDPASGGATDIKALLKQSGGLSLSEVLQQKNLSLTDLLSGKQRAISALKMTENEDPAPPREYYSHERDSPADTGVAEGSSEIKHRRLPPVSRATKQYTARKTIQSPGRQYAISTIRISETDYHEERDTLIDEDGADETEKPQQQRLPPVNKRTQQSAPIKVKEETIDNPGQEKKNIPQRRLPPVYTGRRKQSQPTKQYHETTTEKIVEESGNINTPWKITNENLVKQIEEEFIETTEIPIDESNWTETMNETVTVPTTTIKPTTTTQEHVVQNRLSLKPRLRLPTIKQVPKRISNPTIQRKAPPNESSTNKIVEAVLPAKAIPISIKDIFGMSEMMPKQQAVKEKTTLPKTTTTTTQQTIRTRSTTTPKPIKTLEVSPTLPNAKEEILEVLKDIIGGEQLTKALSERNMSLNELVELRERGSSQLHLADIFHNSSKEPSALEPFLSKSMIEPISRQIYPLKALLEGNMRQGLKETENVLGKIPPPFPDTSKHTHNEENLGIVTLFDKFSQIGGLPKIFDLKDIKKDSDGSSYFTSVINVKPTKEIYKESRNELGYHSSNKQISEIFSSIPTYINTEEIINARVIPDWKSSDLHSNIHGHENSERDLDGDGLIVLEDLQPIEVEKDRLSGGKEAGGEDERGKVAAGMRSAIVVSSGIVGTSLIVFLSILVACRVRQRQRTLRYEERLGGPGGGRLRSGTPAAPSSRSASPILSLPHHHHHQWDTSSRKPFQ